MDHCLLTSIQAASFVGPKTVAVAGNEYTADHILIAVGGVPSLPPISGAEHAITSDGFFQLESLPSKVAVVGAGYIGVELAGVLHELGADTTIFFRGDTVLRPFDDMIKSTLMSEMAKNGMKLKPNSSPKVSVERNK